MNDFTNMNILDGVLGSLFYGDFSGLLIAIVIFIVLTFVGINLSR